ncbi:hypothetical protein GCM10027034_31820 [Ramlibacter solisilvae]|uniref:Uncharacterized protein n=1 Tax=Ramlibacter tataouinensis TaxID=94132 RepID=A0A127JRY8_9BURK|nr:hypothetical protein [Ramlibacter tataouinensis]AMO22717.1 hypothetical protein UC35_07275 [Ramlibacter tataouinensis]
MKIDQLGSETARLIFRSVTLLVLIGAYSVSDLLLGLDGVWTVLAMVVAVACWWQSDLAWKLGTRHLRAEPGAPADRDRGSTLSPVAK